MAFPCLCSCQLEYDKIDHELQAHYIVLRAAIVDPVV